MLNFKLAQSHFNRLTILNPSSSHVLSMYTCRYLTLTTNYMFNLHN